MVIAQLLAGIILLLIGGDALVRSAVAVAKRLHVSPLLIGLTLVGFGTSTPELVTSVRAALDGSPGIAIGNVIGSNTANILLILGITALIHPLTASRRAHWRDGSVMVAAALACLAIVLSGSLARPMGIGLVALLAGYVVYTYTQERAASVGAAGARQEQAALAEPTPRRIWVAGLVALAGLLLTILGADLLVRASIALAEAVGISESVIGLTIVAVGTSLPELVTSVIAAVRRQSDVAYGNIVGSNIYNIFGILGVTAIIRPIEVPTEFASLDIWVMLGATVALIVFTLSGWRLSRLEAAAFLAAYSGYMFVLLI